MNFATMLALVVSVLVFAPPHPAWAAPDFKHLRGLHMMGNWAGNVMGFKSPLLAEAPAISVAHAEVQAVISSGTDANGVQFTNDMALIKLVGVRLGADAQLQLAGFWIAKNLETGNIFIQFRPTADPNLAGVTGFSGDLTFLLPAGTGTGAPDPAINIADNMAGVTGDARKLALALLAHGPELAAFATYTIGPGAEFGRTDSLVLALTAFRDAMGMADNRYFDFVKSLNVEWLGISVAMHYDSLSNPVVTANACAQAYKFDSGGNYTSCPFTDADLESFVDRARSRGLKIYLTLAFETSLDIDSIASPACHTPAYKTSRWHLGEPVLPSGGAASACIDAADWWWNPAHPQHAVNSALFWNSYTQVAAKYGELAQRLGIGMFSLGTETENLFRSRPSPPVFTNDFKPQLQAMVQAVRAVYSGVLTYDQNSYWLTIPDNGSGYLFTDLDLDVVGISGYFPLTDQVPQRVLSVSELEPMWESVFQNYLVPLQQRNPGKPVVFTEFGYNDDLASPYLPSSNTGSPEPAYTAATPTAGMIQQQNVYRAFYDVNTRYGDLVAGTFIWGNDYFPLNPRACSEIGSTLYCRPAAQTVSAAYDAWKRRDNTTTGMIVEFYNTELDHFFITANAGEAAAIDNGSAGPGWERTGLRFMAGGSTAVCRFYGSLSPGPNSHFYTVDPAECSFLRQLQASTPATQKRWNFESLDFVSTPSANGTCPAGTTPVYRAYNNGFARGVDSNHRITTVPAALPELVKRGWNDEGVVMCAPQ